MTFRKSLGVLALILLLFVILYMTRLFVAENAPSYSYEALQSLDSLTYDEMEADLDYLRQVISEVHPKTKDGLPKPLKTQYDVAMEEIHIIDNTEQFYFLTQRVIQKLQDGHSAVISPAPHHFQYLPFTYEWLKDGIYVTSDREWLKSGDRITAIANYSEQELLHRFGDFFSHDNIYSLKATVNRMHVLTDFSFLQYFKLTEGELVHLQIERGKETLRGSISFEKMRRPLKHSAFPDRHWVGYDLMPERGLAVFHLDACVFNEEYQNTVKAFFKDVKQHNIEHIAIDLRKNSGGTTDVIDHFLQYIDIETYDYIQGTLRHSKHTENAESGKDGLSPFKMMDVPNQVHPDPFNGNIYVLTSNQTASSAVAFAALIQDNGLGTVVGEPTAGNPNTYGDSLLFTLPHSKLSFTVSSKWFERPVPGRSEDGPLLPDILSITTIESILTKTDAQLEKVLAMIK